MKIISLYNIKGGVGKTAGCVNLAYLAAKEGKQTLLLDFDPQGASTYYFKIKPLKKVKAEKLVKKDGIIEKNVKSTDYENLDLLPANFSLRNLDLILDNHKKSEKKFRSLLHGLDDTYDYLFIDCAPNITLSSENIFFVSDYIILPFIPSTLSILTYDKLIKFFKDHKYDMSKIIPYFSLVDRRKKMHKEIVAELKGSKKNFLETEIPYSSVVEQMGLHRKPVLEISPRSKASLAFVELWEELKSIF